jgi:hypothetical protein
MERPAQVRRTGEAAVDVRRHFGREIATIYAINWYEFGRTPAPKSIGTGG